MALAILLGYTTQLFYEKCNEQKYSRFLMSKINCLCRKNVHRTMSCKRSRNQKDH